MEVLWSHSGLAEARPAKAVVGRYGRVVPGTSEVAEPCELITLAPRGVLVMRFRSPAAGLPRGFFHRYALMLRYMRQHGQVAASSPFAIYDNIDGNAADVEAGFVIASDGLTGAMPGRDVAVDAERGGAVTADLGGRGSEADGALDVTVKRLPGATVAALVHGGSYADIEPSYFKLLEWVHGRGLTRSGRFMETYLNSPLDTPESELRTLLMVPVGPLSANDL